VQAPCREPPNVTRNSMSKSQAVCSLGYAGCNREDDATLAQEEL